MTTINIPAGTRVLAVEDNAVRNDYFRKMIPGVVIAETVDSAMDALENQSFDLVFLDHDCINKFVDRMDPDYNQLTFWVAAVKLNVMNFPGVVVIHSGNPVGAARMAELLRDRWAGTTFVQPFGSFEIVYG